MCSNNSRPILLKRNTPGLLLTLALACCGTTQAACNEDGIDWYGKTPLKKYLDTCKRPPHDNERHLYTWGHRDKLTRLMREGYSAFRDFNDAQQFVYAGFNDRKQLLEFANHPLFPRYVKVVRGSYGLDSVGILRARLRDERIMDALTGLWHRTLKSGKIPGPELTHRHAPAHAVLQAIALNKVTPGFIDDLPKSLEQLLEETANSLTQENRAELSEQQIRIAEGRLLGLQRAQRTQQAPALPRNKPSNISFGPAMYLARKPSRFVSHFYDNEHVGLVCSLDNGTRITDLGGAATTSTLVQRGVYMGRYDEEMDRYIERDPWPSGYNQLADPPAFRKEMQRRILKRDQNYADSGVIRYHSPGVCRHIQLDDFTQCEDIGILLATPLFRGEPGEHPLYDYLITPHNNDAEVTAERTAQHRIKQLASFRNQVSRCVKPNAGTHRMNVCNAINDPTLARSRLASDLGKPVLSEWRNSCQEN